jgi:alpha-N-arabinofuranosidase
MNRRDFLKESMAAGAAFHLYGDTGISPTRIVEPAGMPGIPVPHVDTDRITTSIDPRIYGEFLENINHSVEDGLFAEQIRGAGFEGEDFKTYWEPFAERGEANIANVDFLNGKEGVRLRVEGGRASIK